jgi:HD-GYP domain-containing protein (c-di-GMP phosphodiesterase class II)
MATTAAERRTFAAGSADELVRDARERYAGRGVATRTRFLLAASGVAACAAIVGAAVILPGGPAFSPLRAAVFILFYAAVSRVEFEVGSGSAIPTELVLVPMLFALPVGMVPAAVAAALVLRTVPDRPWPLRDPSRALPQVAAAAHALGPALVISLAGGLPLHWGAWPVYLAALAAQFATDFANAAVNGAATGVDVRSLARFAGLAYACDAALAPIGLAIAFATRDHWELAGIALPLVALLRYFAAERKQRIDSALELSDAYRGTAFLLGDVVEADDAYTGSHSRHVVDLVLAVADELRLSAADKRDAEFVALLHDVGKIKMPAEIINKPGPLDDRERALMETHTIEGERLLEQVGGLIGHVGRLVRSCHERWDGAGYPDRLAGDEIPLIARVVCACDAYSAMTTDRSYRAARSRAEALAELWRCAGTHFDPAVVDAIARVELANAG